MEVTASFPEACRFVLETPGDVYEHDMRRRSRKTLPIGPLTVSSAVQAQLAQQLVEPNSGLGEAITSPISCGIGKV